MVHSGILREDIKQGERVQKYRLDWDLGKGWEPMAEGQVIGHCRIHKTESKTPSAIRLTITENKGTPVIREFAMF